MVILPSIRRKYMVSRIPKGATVSMSECVVTLAADSVQYTGSPRTVGVVVTWEGATLAVNTDYTLSFSNNKNVGPATVTVTGMGQFSGSVTKTFYVVSVGGATWLDFDLAKTAFVKKSATPVGDVPAAWERVRAVSPDGKTLFPMHKKLYAVSFASAMSLDSYLSTEAGTNDVFYGNEGKGSIAWSADGLHYAAIGYRLSPSGVMSYYAYLLLGETSEPFAVDEVAFATEHYKALGQSSTGTVSVSADGLSVFYSAGYASSISAGDTGTAGLYRVSLASPFDITGAGDPVQVLAAGALTSEARTFRNAFLSPDGTVLIAVWNRWIQKFTLSTPYDVSTRTLHSAFDPYEKAGNDGGNFCGCVIGNDGTKMILYSAGTQTLYEFTLSA